MLDGPSHKDRREEDTATIMKPKCKWTQYRNNTVLRCVRCSCAFCVCETDECVRGAEESNGVVLRTCFAMPRTTTKLARNEQARPLLLLNVPVSLVCSRVHFFQ
jgi:hypothetical protein